MVTVRMTRQFHAWVDALDRNAREAVFEVIEMLKDRGVHLREPHTKSIEGTTYPLRELRTKALRRAVRAIYAFDPRRDAVLLIGGIKAGNDKHFYKGIVPKAERIWIEYLRELKKWQ
ncbi:MAG: type II toxin-antitoxin system RelE/ParE family toxin [Candidatus Binatia bacterium]